MNYHLDTIRVNQQTVVSLRSVESMGFPVDGELIIDILKDDLQINIVMASGKEYVVSMALLQQTNPHYANADKNELRGAVFDKWVYLLGNKK
jgi:hypothetical protein